MSKFDLTSVLAQHTHSVNTQRAYYRWIDRFLVDVAQYSPTKGEMRIKRMATLNVATLQRHVTDRKLVNWLAKLAEENQSRQALDQARASIVTLSDLLGDSQLLPAEAVTAIRKVHVPPVERKMTPERLLNGAEIKTLISLTADMATSENQRLRNNVVTAFLCTLALRREELSSLKWGDIVLREGKPCIRIENDYLEMPRNILNAVDRWRNCFTGTLQAPPPESPLIRRIWKGGRISKDGLSPDGIWLIIHEAAQVSQLGTVTPDDLRRSVVATMRSSGASVEDINRLLRHRSLLVTERFLAKLNDPDNS